MSWHWSRGLCFVGFLSVASGLSLAARAANDVLPPVTQRFADAAIEESPSFQKHVVPLFGQLGCNGRSCHGSFQGRGGFRLSLFGYDFEADLKALTEKDHPRINLEQPLESLILVKPTDEDQHEGGLRFKKDSWQYNVFRKWLQDGGKFDASNIALIERLDITPSELSFASKGETVNLRVVAVWRDGAKEDVTPLCRFQTNNEQLVSVTQEGKVTAGDPGDSHVVVFYDNAVVPIPVIRPVSNLAGKKYPKVATPTKIDELVVAKLKKLGIVPSDLSQDAEFLRRVSLDMTGTLPTVKQVETFLADKSPDKRAKKIDELLETPGYAAWWTTKLCDFTGNNDAQLNQAVAGRNAASASQNWYDWIHKRIADNTSYDKIVEGLVTATSRNAGESYTEFCERMSDLYRKPDETKFCDFQSMPLFWMRRDFRMPEPRTINFAYAFMGIRIECAQCHKHPFDQWSKKDFEQFTNLFRNVTFSQNGARKEDQKEYNELVKQLGTIPKGNQAQKEFAKLLGEGKTVPFPELYTTKAQRGGKGASPTSSAKLLGGETIDLTQTEDGRVALMEWLRQKDNPFFARAFVNRVWANYFNVGIVQPPDDMSLANPPSNRALLDYLASQFTERGYDIKWVHREIANSRTYQLSWRPNDTNRADERNFSRSVPRRLQAETALDALQIATASDDMAEKLHKEVSGRAIAVPGSSAQSKNKVANSFALTVFGRSVRESNCDCDRSSEASLLQTVFMQNDRDVLSMLDQKNSWMEQVGRQLAAQKKQADAANAEPPANAPADKKIVFLKRQVERLKKAGNTAELEKTQARLAELESPAGSDAETKPEASAPTPSVDTTALVKQAYLRTLSRYPHEEEMTRSVKYIEDSEDVPAGVRGVLWALLNTKEFIVNH